MNRDLKRERLIATSQPKPAVWHQPSTRGAQRAHRGLREQARRIISEQKRLDKEAQAAKKAPVADVGPEFG